MSNFDPGEEGWKVVSGIDEERQIEKWERSKGHWSGSGKNPSNWNDKAIETQEELGSGTFGLVERISFKAVTMARKHIKLSNRLRIENIREEANVMERLSHKHIVKLIGTYTTGRRRVRNVELDRDFFLLLHPAAVCDMDDFIRDVGTMISGTCEDRMEAETRLQLLGLKEFGHLGGEKKIPRNSSVGGPARRPSIAIEFLLRSLGCIAEAVAYVHEQKIRHRDLKPKNILLNPGRVYLADFGIARDVRNKKGNTQTYGGTGTKLWKAPEVRRGNCHHMSSADVWSLGCIFLAAITAIYGGARDRFELALMNELDNTMENMMLQKYIQDLQLQATMAWLANRDEINIDVKHILELVQRMLRHDPKERPTMVQVNISLSELGGLNQTFHLQCCHKDNARLTEALHKRLHLAYTNNLHYEIQISGLREEITSYQQRINSLEKARNTAESVLARERKHIKDRYELLLNQEKADRKKLEDQLNSMTRTPFRQPNSQVRGRGRSNGLKRNDSQNGGKFHKNGHGSRQHSKDEREIISIQRRPSGLPLPVRPSTPLHPNRGNNRSGNNTSSPNSTSKPSTPLRPYFGNRKSGTSVGNISSANSSSTLRPITPACPPPIPNPESGNSTLTSSTYSVFSVTKESVSSVASSFASIGPETPESPTTKSRPKFMGYFGDSLSSPKDVNGKGAMSRETSKISEVDQKIPKLEQQQSPKPSWAKLVAQASSIG